MGFFETTCAAGVQALGYKGGCSSGRVQAGYNLIGRATRFVVSGFPTLLILGPPLLILGPTLLILGPTLLILVVKMGIAIREKTQTIQTVDLGFE